MIQQQQPYKDFGEVDFTEHEIDIIQEQSEKVNQELEELGI